MGAALLGAKRFAGAAKELRETLTSNRDWNPNDDLRWSALHLLSAALSAQGKFGDAVAISQEARKFVVQGGQRGVSIRVQQALSAWDYASSVGHWEGATAEQRVEALRELDQRTAGLYPRYAVLAGALLEAPPGPARDRASEKDARHKSLRGRPPVRVRLRLPSSSI
jgi:hypothetical protein